MENSNGRRIPWARLISELVGQNKAALAERIARWARLAFPMIFGAVLLLIWWM